MIRALLLLALLAPPASAGPGWRERMDDALARGWLESPELYEAWSAAPAAPTRGGGPRLMGPGVADPRLAPLLLGRLVDGGEDPSTRLALAEALPRTGGDWEEAAAELSTSDADPAVRAVLVSGMRHASAEAALPALRRALADPDAHVRAEAARAAGWRPEGAALADALTRALADRDATVRAHAARALGWLGVGGSFGAIRALLGDPDGQARLFALRALERLDPAATAALPELARLAADPDPRVARAAAGLGR